MTFTCAMLSGALIKLAFADEFPFIFISFLLCELFSAVTKMLRWLLTALLISQHWAIIFWRTVEGQGWQPKSLYKPGGPLISLLLSPFQIQREKDWNAASPRHIVLEQIVLKSGGSLQGQPGPRELRRGQSMWMRKLIWSSFCICSRHLGWRQADCCNAAEVHEGDAALLNVRNKIDL